MIRETQVTSRHDVPLLVDGWEPMVIAANLSRLLTSIDSHNIPSTVDASEILWSLVYTLPETNIAPENNTLEKEIPIGNHHF